MSEIQDVKVDQAVLARAEWAVEAAKAVALQKDNYYFVLNRIDDVTLFTNGYAEPGYNKFDESWCGIVAIGNWNSIDRYNSETRENIVVDNTACRLGDVLDKLGVELEWSDEWDECHECHRLVRTSPNSYSWTPSYYQIDGTSEKCCLDCMDEAEYLEGLENSAGCNTIVDDPSDRGYQHVKSFEHGMYGGQDADPKLIMEIMRKASFSRFIFHIESQGQFDTRFALYLHDEETTYGGLDRAKIAVGEGRTDGPSVVEAMKRGMKQAAVQEREVRVNGEADGGAVVSTIGMNGATTRVVSAEDFIAGKALEK